MNWCRPPAGEEMQENRQVSRSCGTVSTPRFREVMENVRGVEREMRATLRKGGVRSKARN